MKTYKEILDENWKLAIGPREKNAPTVISTFSGCGGSSLGYKMAGFDVKLAVEWDAHAVECYKLNFPTTDVYHGDISKLSVEDVLKRTGLKVGELSLFDGSPPCQGFSTAGKRDLGDNRNQLFLEYVRLLRGLQPKTFVMENVTGMVKGKMRLIFVECLKELKASGYNVSCRILNASWYGVPQSRQRTIFIGVRNDLNIKPSHPIPSHRPISIRNAIIDCQKNEIKKLSDTIFSWWKKTMPGNSLSSIHPKQNFFNMKKLDPDIPSLTITKIIGLLHWSEPRFMNLSEIKRIGSFPDQFKLVGSFQAQWARIGNSVPPLMIKAIAEHIKKTVLDKKTVVIRKKYQLNSESCASPMT